MSFFKWQVSFSSNFVGILLSQTLYALQKRDKSKWKFFRIFSARIKIHKILAILKQKITFSLNFTELFGITRHNSSIPAVAKKCGSNVKQYKSVYQPIPTRENREYLSNCQNESVSSAFKSFVILLSRIKLLFFSF